jgi:hypothetical protein
MIVICIPSPNGNKKKHFPIKGPTKNTQFIGIFGLKIYHLQTLAGSPVFTVAVFATLGIDHHHQYVHHRSGHRSRLRDPPHRGDEFKIVLQDLFFSISIYQGLNK